MKKLFTLTLAVALAFGSQSFAAEAKKKKDAPAEDAATKPKAADTAAPKAEGGKATPKAEGEAKAKTAKGRGFYISADEIDAKEKAFTHVSKKDNKKVKYVVTATTEIANDGKPAKFEDIKVGDYVSGSLMPKSDTENEVVKITKFGPRPAKGEGEAKKKPEGDAPKSEGEPKKKGEGEAKKDEPKKK